MDFMESNHFFPLHSGHSIEQVIFSVRFDGTVNDECFRKLYELQSQDESLPGKNSVMGISQNMGGIALPPGMLRPAQMGASFSYSLPDGSIQRELMLDRGVIGYRTSFYTRWDDCLKTFGEYLRKLIPIYISGGVGLSAVSLAYVDRYVSSGIATRDDVRTLLRESSPYLTKHAYEATDLWHAHTGSFVVVNEFIKRLINVNIDYLDGKSDPKKHRSIVIRTTLTDLFNEIGFQRIEINDHIQFIEERLISLHDLDKKILADILSDEMSRRIALGGS